jgi:hypothetical protein
MPGGAKRESMAWFVHDVPVTSAIARILAQLTNICTHARTLLNGNGEHVNSTVQASK